MKRRAQVCAWLGVATGLLACGNEPAPNEGAAGSSSAGVAGSLSASAGSGGANAAGTSSSAGAAGTTVTGGSPSAGSGGQAAGSSAGGALAGQGGSGGAALGGSGGSAGSSSGGTAGAGGAGGGGGSGGGASTLPKRVLLYHFSTLAIDTLQQQLSMLKSQLQTWGYETEDSVKPEDIGTTNLARFGGVGMINTCFEPFGAGNNGAAQTAALKAFVEAGGGLFGTHCASVTFQSAKPPNAYNDVIGGRGGDGYFDGTSACTTVEAHPTTMQLPATFNYMGNLDNADYVAADTKVLVKCKWAGGAMKEHAVSWYRTPGKGRVFFTNFAKVAADLSDPTIGQKHIFAGLSWTLGR